MFFVTVWCSCFICWFRIEVVFCITPMLCSFGKLTVGYFRFVCLVQVPASYTTESSSSSSFNMRNSSTVDQLGNKEEERNYSDFSFLTKTNYVPLFQSSTSMFQVVSCIAFLYKFDLKEHNLGCIFFFWLFI